MHMWRTFICPLLIGKLSLMCTNAVEMKSFNEMLGSSIDYMIVMPLAAVRSNFSLLLQLFIIIVKQILLIIAHWQKHPKRPTTRTIIMRTNTHKQKKANQHKQWIQITEVFPMFACNGTFLCYCNMNGKYDNNQTWTNKN